KGDGLDEHHHIPIEAKSPTKKEKAKDLRLIFTDLVTVKFLSKNDTPETKRGWWCNTCRNDKEFVEKNGQRKAFHTGSNSSCRLHICQHYTRYQELCKQENIPEHHWAIPCSIWNEREAAKKGK
ncbi:hypothetical protein L208DRAFT_1069017, partial [Tricholoma matsutake]